MNFEFFFSIYQIIIASLYSVCLPGWEKKKKKEKKERKENPWKNRRFMSIWRSHDQLYFLSDVLGYFQTN